MINSNHLNKIIKNDSYSEVVLVNRKNGAASKIKPVELLYGYYSRLNKWEKLEETPKLDYSVHEGLLYVGYLPVTEEIRKEIYNNKNLWHNNTPPCHLDLFINLGGAEVSLYLGVLNSGLYK